MPVPEACGVNHQNVRQFDALRLLPAGTVLDQQVSGGLKGFLKSALGTSPGSIEAGTAQELVKAVADYEDSQPLSRAQPFRYASVPNLPGQYPEHSAESTVASALANMRFMVDRFGPETFAAASRLRRQRAGHAALWKVPLDDDYEIRIRGGSGAGTFSIDFGLGVVSRANSRPRYKELWRAGIDTVESGDTLGARFIRTGSGIKNGDAQKHQAFDEFRKRQRIMPQRLLGMVGLYFMRELEPDYALALTTEGAQRLSTLGRSSGRCDYTGIFSDIGFLPSDDPNWLLLPDFADGFYSALDRSDIQKHESHRLHEAVEGIKDMQAVTPSASARPKLFTLCSDESQRTIEREVIIALPEAA